MSNDKLAEALRDLLFCAKESHDEYDKDDDGGVRHWRSNMFEKAITNAQEALQAHAAEAAQTKIGDFDARDSFTVHTDTTTLQRNAAEVAQAQPSGDSLVADLHAAGFETFEPRDLGDDTRQTWTCRIGTRAGVHVPPGGDAPMRDAVQSAFMALTGECAEACFSGWGDKFTESELAVIENRAPKAESGR